MRSPSQAAPTHPRVRLLKPESQPPCSLVQHTAPTPHAAATWCMAALPIGGLSHQGAHRPSASTPQHQGRCKGTCPLDSSFKRARRAWAIQVFFAGGGAACGPLCKGADFLWVVGLNHLMAHANRKIESNPPPQPQVPAPEAN